MSWAAVLVASTPSVFRLGLGKSCAVVAIFLFRALFNFSASHDSCPSTSLSGLLASQLLRTIPSLSTPLGSFQFVPVLLFAVEPHITLCPHTSSTPTSTPIRPRFDPDLESLATTYVYLATQATFVRRSAGLSRDPSTKREHTDTHTHTHTSTHETERIQARAVSSHLRRQDGGQGQGAGVQRQRRLGRPRVDLHQGVLHRCALVGRGRARARLVRPDARIAG